MAITLKKLIVCTLLTFMCSATCYADTYCNGARRSTGSELLYPNGRKITSMGRYFYPNGVAIENVGTPQYPNQNRLFSVGESYYMSGDRVMRAGDLYFPNGRRLKSGNDCYDQYGKKLQGCPLRIGYVEQSGNYEIRGTLLAEKGEIVPFLVVRERENGVVTSFSVDFKAGKIHNVFAYCHQ